MLTKFSSLISISITTLVKSLTYKSLQSEISLAGIITENLKTTTTKMFTDLMAKYGPRLFKIQIANKLYRTRLKSKFIVIQRRHCWDKARTQTCFSKSCIWILPLLHALSRNPIFLYTIFYFLLDWYWAWTQPFFQECKCTKRRLRSECVSAHSDQSLCWELCG